MHGPLPALFFQHVCNYKKFVRDISNQAAANLLMHSPALGRGGFCHQSEIPKVLCRNVSINM